MSNSDELFECDELSAAADIGWPDIFNSGVFVYSPSLDTYRALLQHAITVGSFDGKAYLSVRTCYPECSRLELFVVSPENNIYVSGGSINPPPPPPH